MTDEKKIENEVKIEKKKCNCVPFSVAREIQSYIAHRESAILDQDYLMGMVFSLTDSNHPLLQVNSKNLFEAWSKGKEGIKDWFFALKEFSHKALNNQCER